MHEKFGEDWTCSSEDMIVDRQTHTQTDTAITIIRSPIDGGTRTHARTHAHIHTHTHTHTFNGPLSGTTRVSRQQKGKTNLDFTEARDSEWQWHQLGNMQI